MILMILRKKIKYIKDDTDIVNLRTIMSDKTNVLLVDDRPENLLALEVSLEDLDLNLVKATSGNEALGFLVEKEFALVLLDVQMPDMDGFEVAGLMRKNEVTRGVPIIFVTAENREQKYIFEGYEAGAVDFLYKPIMPEFLRSKVKVFVELYQQKLLLQRQTKELERSNGELEQFAYVASHDLQEPLRMVVSYVQLLQRRYKDKLDKDANEFIAYAVDGSKRMQELINDLLALSRIGKRGKDFELTDCETVIDRVVSNLEMSIRESGAKITRDSMPTLIADNSQLVQLFQNLIGNAIKYCNEDVPRIHISVKQNGKDIVFSVSDNGIGIDPQYNERIFTIFQRLHGKDKYSGTGIGLAICRKIVERHGGKIRVGSQPGKGSTFYFTMPNLNKSE